MSELLRCPFCGGEAKTVKSDIGCYSVICSSCNTGIFRPRWTPDEWAAYATEAEAIAAWNTRAERTCKIESTIFIEGEYVPCPYYEYEMECGGQFRWDDVEPPNCCPCCGAKVVIE